MTELDHLVYGVPDLLAGVRHFHELTGVEPVAGGRHEGRGTANYLVTLGNRSYLEIIGPDPDSDASPSWFNGLDRLPGPGLLTWAVRTDDIAAAVSAAQAASYDPGDAIPMSRRTSDGALLRWQLTPDTVAAGGVVPFLIDWGDSPHPTTRALPGLTLVSFTVLTPTPNTVTASIHAVGASATVEYADTPGLRCELDGPAGRVMLSS